MLMTDYEATKEQCPLSFGRNSAPDRCMGSRCKMGWRWAKGSSEVGGIKRRNPEDSRPLGYCGFAGKPEVEIA